MAAAGSGAQQQRLFDKEADNQHEEPLLLAQLAAAQLRALLETASAANVDSLPPVVEWASKSAQVGNDRAQTYLRTTQFHALLRSGSSCG